MILRERSFIVVSVVSAWNKEKYEEYLKTAHFKATLL